ncbi:MAG: alpha/beta hydrolase [Planctomycetaceae bacterium]|nr:alpha/beta hydrolase [Planctomycetaceae bacterium]
MFRSIVMLTVVCGVPSFQAVLNVAGAAEPDVAVGSRSEVIRVWPDRAPGEMSTDQGETQPPREGEDPPVTRVTGIRFPTMDVFPAAEPNGTAVVVLPGGGFGKVVTDKEGSEAAPWLNGLGISVFVLRYRTNEVTPKSEPAWRRPLQDVQRSLRLIRANADRWKIDGQRVGVLGFSAGGQVASILHTAGSEAAYDAVDEADRQRCQPDFSLLIYPWQITNSETQELLPQIQPSADSPPAFLVHTHDDRSTSLGAVLVYAGLKKHGVPAELHVYQNGGHGYGMRPVAGSDIGTWPNRATTWLKLNQLAR